MTFKTIKDKKIFTLVFKKGDKISIPEITIIFLKSKNISEPYFGITIKKNFFQAFQRNKIKRQIREYIRSFLKEGILPKDNYYIFNVKSNYNSKNMEIYKNKLRGRIDSKFVNR